MVGFGKASGGGRREVCREAAPLQVTMTTISASYSARLVDLSATGARLRCEALPPLGLELDLTVGRIKTFCTVRWSRGSGTSPELVAHTLVRGICEGNPQTAVRQRPLLRWLEQQLRHHDLDLVRATSPPATVRDR